jgi:hypothetical protein
MIEQRAKRTEWLDQSHTLEDHITLIIPSEFPCPCSPSTEVMYLINTTEGPIRRPERGGSEWEPIKILLRRENSAYTPNSQPRIPTRVFQGHIVTTDVPTLGTNPKQSQRGSTKQEAKDLATLQQPRRTIRGHLANCPRSPRGRSTTHGGLSVIHKKNDPTGTSTRRRSVPRPQTVREQLVPRGQSATSGRTVHSTPSHQKTLANRIKTKVLKNMRRTQRTLGPKGSTRTVREVRTNTGAAAREPTRGLLRKDLGKM